MVVTAASLSLVSVVVGSITFGFLVGVLGGLALGIILNR